MGTKIHRIKRYDGTQVEIREEVGEELVNHFKEIMTEDNGDRDRHIAWIMTLIPRTISREDNENLSKPITMQEVEEAMSQMAQGKTPGPDGFATNFFHFFWEMIKEEFWAILEESRSKRGVLKSFNATFLSLIPKGEGGDSPGKFRPISLCNVIYKIITKVIANRLKPLLPVLISPEQWGFVEVRQILDGIIAVHETIHSLKCTK